jgi:ubiquitin-conjugating enzyme E2 R
MSELAALQKEKWVHFSDVSTFDRRLLHLDTHLLTWLQLDNMNIQKWQFALMVINTDSAFNGGYFKVRLLPPAPSNLHRN